MISEFIGGGFGAKQGAGVEAVLAAELARATGRPVRLALVAPRGADRRRQAGLDTPDRDARRAPRRDAHRRSSSPPSSTMGVGGWVFPVAEPALSLYACPNVRAMAFPVRTSLRAQNAFRAPGVVEGVTVLEQAMDELAAALDLDPLELRRRNHVDRDQASGLPYSSKRLLACYDRAAELAGWAGRDALREPQADGLLRGMGCAHADLVGRRRPARTRDRSASTPTARARRHDGHPGHRHRDAHVGAHGRRGGARAPARARARARRRHAPNLYGPVSGGSMTTPAVMPAVRSAAGEGAADAPRAWRRTCSRSPPTT